MDRTVSYRREMNHNYLMLEAESGQENSYVTKMLMENSIDGLLKFRVKKIDGCCDFCYENDVKDSLLDGCWKVTVSMRKSFGRW